MKAASTSEMSVNFYQTTQCNIPKDSHLQKKDAVRERCGKDGEIRRKY
jgi:hypothetical protein